MTDYANSHDTGELYGGFTRVLRYDQPSTEHRRPPPAVTARCGDREHGAPESAYINVLTKIEGAYLTFPGRNQCAPIPLKSGKRVLIKVMQSARTRTAKAFYRCACSHEGTSCLGPWRKATAEVGCVVCSKASRRYAMVTAARDVQAFREHRRMQEATRLPYAQKGRR